MTLWAKFENLKKNIKQRESRNGYRKDMIGYVILYNLKLYTGLVIPETWILVLWYREV